MDENTQQLIQVVSKHVDDDNKDLALQFLLDTINNKQQQNYKNSIEMNKFILYEVNEYIKTLSRTPKIISFDDSIPKYENVDSILQRTIQERQYIDIDDYKNVSIPDMLVEQINIDNNEKEEKNKDNTILEEDSNDIRERKKETIEDIELSISSVVWIDNIKQNEDNTLIISLEKEWKKTSILQVALDKQYGTGDFIHVNGMFFQKVGYAQYYTQYNIYKGKYPCREDNDELEITTYPDKQIVEWNKDCNPLLIQIFHQH